MSSIDKQVRRYLRRAHGWAAMGDAGIVSSLEDFDLEYLSVELNRISDAAKHYEDAARELRDLVAVIKAQEEASNG